MDWKVFASTFGVIFLAELGDKTQFAAMAAAAGSRSIYSVLLAVVLALAIAGCLGVLAGKILGGFLNVEMMKYISGSAFILIGLWTLLSR